MARDIRQVVAAFLTLSMFVMLGNMIKRDHFDSFEQMKLPLTSNLQYGEVKVTKQSLVTLPTLSNNGPWKNYSNHDVESLKPCWNKQILPTRNGVQSKGYITFSLSNGPEYHASQIADAVLVAKYLKATLVVPDIRGSKPGENMSFEEIYDTERFVKSLDGLINVVKKQPAGISNGHLGVLKIPNRVSEDYIATHVEPLFKKTGNLRLATYFPSKNMRKSEEIKHLDTFACLAMFGTQKLQAEVQEVVDSMVGRLRTLSRKSKGQFIAVDLKVEMLREKGCQISGATGEKSCYDAQEIGEFLNKIGFNRDTTVYVTQSRWHNSLDELREIFPKTYTKEGIMPTGKNVKFLSADKSEFGKVIDFYICSQSDVFVPAISGIFYTNVAGKRIAAGKTQILVPGRITTSAASTADYISPYISKKNHFAYSCFC